MGWLTAFREDAYPERNEFAGGGEFSLADAAALAWAAQLAYEVSDSEKFRRILQSWGWGTPTVLSGRFASHLPLVNTKGYVVDVGGATVIAFAGTEPTDLFNWITDFYIHRTAEGIAGGFNAAVDAVWPTLSQRIRAAAGNIFLAGHSLGAALAAVTANRLIAAGVTFESRLGGVYTIGMPRPGDEVFATAYNARLGRRTYRLIHGEDIVPKVPPAAAPFGCRHIGRALYCLPGGEFVERDMGALSDENPSGLIAALDELRSALFTRPRPSRPTYPGEHALATALVGTLAPAARDHLCDCYLRSLRVLGR